MLQSMGSQRVRHNLATEQQSLWRTVWRFLKKLKTELPYDPAIPLLGMYLEKTVIQKDIWTPAFTAAPFTTTTTEAT